MERPRINLKFWQGQGDLKKLSLAVDTFFDRVKNWLAWLPQQVDADTAPLEIVNLLAWGRDIDRLPNEPESIYRKRVKYALVNARDAATVAGFARIWSRLGLGYVGQNERISSVDWDVIELELSESSISENGALLMEVIRMYGRTCRRYTYKTITYLPMTVRCFEFNNCTDFSVATAQHKTARVTTRVFEFSNVNDLDVAT